MSAICFNGKYFREQEAILPASNRAYRYGDGFFETMRIWNENILLSAYHKNRIEKTIDLLQYKAPVGFSTEKLFREIITLCIANNCGSSARVRLSFSNGNGGLSDLNHPFNYLIETWPIATSPYPFAETGLTVGIFPAIRKSCDKYANIKSSSALLYSLASRYALQQQWDDCIVLNQHGNICETTIGNIFWIKNDQIFTPALTEGSVAGVMRAWLLDNIKNVQETTGTPQDLEEADELFMTNAIKGIHPIKNLKNGSDQHPLTSELHRQYILPLHRD